jgi:hypothetical protein
MFKVRKSPSGKTAFREVLSGTITVPANQDGALGPVLKREPGERFWVFVFPITIDSSGPLGIVGIPAKTPDLAPDEWQPFFLVPGNGGGPRTFPILADFTIVAVEPDTKTP